MTEEPSGYDVDRRNGVLAVSRPDTEWLSTGANGGRCHSQRAYNISVPDNWGYTDLTTYVDDRLERAGFDAKTSSGDRPPALLTGVGVTDARGARCGSVVAYATAGISNPAALPMDPPGGSLPEAVDPAESGTVNLIVGTTRSLTEGALSNLLAVVAEAKAATLLEQTGVPGTTTDAIIIGHDPTGRPARFSGSGTPVGAAARACVRDSLTAGLSAHYADREQSISDAATDADHGVSTDVRTKPIHTLESP